MTTYVYKAKKSASETVSGSIKAQSQDEAIDLINQLGLLPVSIQEQAGNSSTRGSTNRLRRVSTKDCYIFSRQLSNLLKSGISLLRALGIIEEQTQNKYFKEVIADIASNIRNGRAFSKSLAEYPNIFSNLYITMVSAGEESGKLQEMVVHVAIHQQKQNELASKVRTALVYPCLMGIVGIATIYFILTFVIPKMSSLFATIGSALPLPTRILLSLSHLLSVGWFWVLLVVVVISMSLVVWGRSQIGKSFGNRVLLSMPVFGDLVLKSELARFCRTLVLLLRGGVNIVKALQVAIPILNNDVIRDDLEKCKNQLLGGGSFGVGIRSSKKIPAMMGHLISVGEEAGTLNDVLTEIAINYEQEADEKIKMLTTLLEPMMILAVGAIVGFMVFAILIPIFQMDVLSG